MTFFAFLLQKKYRKGSVDISRIKCVEVVKSDGIIPCQNKYPFQVCVFYVKYINHSALFNSTKPFGYNLLEITVTSKYRARSLALWCSVGGGSGSVIKNHPQHSLLPLQCPPLGLVPHTLGPFLFPTLSAWLLPGKCLVLVFLQKGLAGSPFSLPSFFHIKLNLITI